MAESSTIFLMYHELALPGRDLCHAEPGYARYAVSVSDFHGQMNRLASEDWRGKNVSQALQSFESKNVCITFDDGCETDLLCAAPVLKDLGFNATFYITVDFLGKRGYLSAVQLRDLSALGFEIGCHSQTHPYLTDIDDARLLDETNGAKGRLEEIIGGPVHHFSCPGGRWNCRVAAAVKAAKFRSMATSRTGMNFSHTDPFALTRFAVLNDTSDELIARACRGEGLFRIQFKENFRELARQTLGNSAYDALRNLVLGRDQSGH